MAVHDLQKRGLLLSVCMITYNHEKYVAKAIEEILNQETNFQFELVISNDASVDGTHKVISEIISTHPKANRIKYFIHENNLGMIPNFIFAFEHCNGKYIAFCEGDDFWTDVLKLQKQVDFLENNPGYSGTFHETAVLNELNAAEFSNGDRIFGSEISDEITAEDTISQWSLFHTSSFVFKKEAFEIPYWFKNVHSPDMAIFSIVASKGNLKKVPGIMSIYRKHPAGITETAELKNNFYQNRILLTNYLNEYHDFKFEEKAQEVILLHKSEIDKVISNKQKVHPIYGIMNKIKILIKRKIINS